MIRFGIAWLLCLLALLSPLEAVETEILFDGWAGGTAGPSGIFVRGD